MSLLNQVLQDLQDRQAPDVHTAQTTLRDVRIPVHTTARAAQRPWVLWLAILVLAGVSGNLLWQRGQHVAVAPAMTRTRPAPLSAPAIAQTSAGAAVSAPKPAPAIIAAPVRNAVTADQAHAATAIPHAQSAIHAPLPASVSAPAHTATTAAITTKKTAAPLIPPVAKPAAAPPVDAVKITARPLSPEQHAELIDQDALRLLQSGRPSAAEPRLRAALEIYPAQRAARTALAGLMINSGRLSEATRLLAAGLALAPTYAPFAKLYARLRIEKGDLSDARAVLERAAPTAQDDPEYLALLAALYQRLGLYQQAAQTYRGALQAQPRNGVWWLGLGLALEGTGDRANALLSYQRAQQSGTLDNEVLRYVEGKISALQSGNGERR